MSAPLRRAGPEPPSSYLPSVVASMLVLALCALATAVGLLQRGTDPQRFLIDPAIAGALLLNGGIVVLHVRLWLSLPDPRHSSLEVFGASYDPWMGPWMVVLLMTETLAFADYGQWRLTPWLIHGGLRWSGLGLGGAALLLVAWSDRYLILHFAGAPHKRRLITGGPYRLVRHPRYTGLLLTRLSLALLLGSMFAWLLLPCWLLLVLRRIRLEEKHLHTVFGAAYTTYARETGTLLPAHPPSR